MILSQQGLAFSKLTMKTVVYCTNYIEIFNIVPLLVTLNR